jgi:hypothetical protein
VTKALKTGDIMFREAAVDCEVRRMRSAGSIFFQVTIKMKTPDQSYCLALEIRAIPTEKSLPPYEMTKGGYFDDSG